MLQLPAKMIALFMAGVRVNWIQTLEREEQAWIYKRRSIWSGPIVLAGNLVLAIRKPRMKVLGLKAWIEWERLVQSQLRGVTIEPAKNGIGYPRISGTPLSRLLAGSETVTEKRNYIAIATRSLAKLHSQAMPLDDNQVQLSHADAACYNVLVDEERQNAEWFDFDIRHDLRDPASLRFADDLRALIFTSAVFFDAPSLPLMVAIVRDEYSDTNVWLQLQILVSDRRLDFDLFHQAQVRRTTRGVSTQARPPSHRHQQEVVSAILNER
jgi:hypothetical protein